MEEAMFVKTSNFGATHCRSFDLKGIRHRTTLCKRAFEAPPIKASESNGLTCKACIKKLRHVPQSILRRYGLEGFSVIN